MPRTRSVATEASKANEVEKPSEPGKAIESEVFLGGIPHDATEKDLRGFCKSIGEVTEVRIMKGKKSGENKGYAFVMFRTKELASKAMEKLNGSQLKGKKITCSSSQVKHKLFIDNLPRNWGEEDLKKVVEEVGPGVTAIELSKDQQNSSCNRGFAFIVYQNYVCGEYALQKMSKSNFKLGDNSPTVRWADLKNVESSASSLGKRITCSSFVDKYKLSIANLPKNWGDEDLRKVVQEVGPGVNAIELSKDVQNSSRNCGIAFIEYDNYACAEYALRKMSKSNFKLGDNAPIVSWAELKNAESSALSQVKALYIKNLPKDVNQHKLKQLFGHHGRIMKVVLPPAGTGHVKSRFGFVHFADRSSAMKALNSTEKYELEGQVLECSLAKPETDQKSSGGPIPQKPASLPGYRRRGSHGRVRGRVATAYGAPFSALRNEYADIIDMLAEKEKENEQEDKSDESDVDSLYSYKSDEGDTFLSELDEDDEGETEAKKMENRREQPADCGRTVKLDDGRAIRVATPLNVNQLIRDGVSSIIAAVQGRPAAATPPPPPRPQYHTPRYPLWQPSPAYLLTGPMSPYVYASPYARPPPYTYARGYVPSAGARPAPFLYSAVPPRPLVPSYGFPPLPHKEVLGDAGAAGGDVIPTRKKPEGEEVGKEAGESACGHGG